MREAALRRFGRTTLRLGVIGSVLLLTAQAISDRQAVYATDKDDYTRLQLGIPGLVDNSPRLKLCGNRLSDAVVMLCENYGGIYDPSYPSTKRRARSLDTGSAELLDAPLRLQRGSRRSRRESIVEECCRRPCTLAHLFQYCAFPPPFEEVLSQETLLTSLRGTTLGTSQSAATATPSRPPRPPRVGKYKSRNRQFVFLDE